MNDEVRCGLVVRTDRGRRGERCPYCHADIETRPDGVRCAKCGSAHHLSCWEEHKKCSVFGCEGTEHRPLGALETARVIVRVGREAMSDALETARERLGGKSTVGLFGLSVLVTGMGVTPLLYHRHASAKVDIEVVLGALFVILWVWITALLYRGAKIEDDLTLRPLQATPGDYYKRIFGKDPTAGGCSGCFSGSGGSSGSSGSGCDLGGCGSAGGDLEGILVLIVVVVALGILIFVVFPLVAWLAVEIVFPMIVLGTYGALYAALAFAVNSAEAVKGKIVLCIIRATGYAFLYTAIVGVVIGMGIKAYHVYAPPLPH
ncbi:hypothetical protein HY251_08470 [bacterium]|nr:hypothetical protein [bacterium]